MSTTYTDIMREVAESFQVCEASLVLTSPSPVARSSARAAAGSGSKTHASLTELVLVSGGRGAEHGDSAATGRISFTLHPTNASDEAALEALARLAELGHRVLQTLDGRAGIRVSAPEVQMLPSQVNCSAVLTLGMVITVPKTAAQLQGRV